MRVITVVGATLLASGCGKKVAGACGNACAAGEVCIDGACARLCNSSSECPAGLGCIDGVCKAASSAPPVITEVNGTGSADADTTHTPLHLRDRLVVIGENLSGALATLTGINPAVPSVDLAPCGPGSS